MRGLFLSALMFAAAGLMAGGATAQKGLSTGPNLDGIENANRIAENARRKLDGVRKDGIEALQKQDFAGAEKAFAKLVAQDPTLSDAHYLMGIAKIGLKNWADARQFLETAVLKEPTRPDPKARLGVTYVKLNELELAKKQRDELAGLSARCNGCPDAARITENLALLDRALAPPAPNSAPAN
jgi:tetratricopeptide (TPR) repeat protein